MARQNQNRRDCIVIGLNCNIDTCDFSELSSFVISLIIYFGADISQRITFDHVAGEFDGDGDFQVAFGLHGELCLRAAALSAPL